MSRVRLIVAGTAATLLLAACGQGGNESTLTITGTPPAGPVPSGVPQAPDSSESALPPSATDSGTPEPSPGDDTQAPRVLGTIASGLQAPWGLDFFDNGDALVTERDTRRVLRVSGRNRVVQQVGEIEAASPENEAGLLGVAISPTFARDQTVYFYISAASDNRVVRARLSSGKLSPVEPIFTGIPRGSIHDGGRIEFGPDGYLYVSTGEAGQPDLAQDRDSLGGKILRITTDGDPAPDNPFGTAVWTEGHRNVQGLAFDGKRLWASEFGEKAFDELNLITSGENYGWPQVEGKGGEDQGFVDPQRTWNTDDASPSGLTYTDGYLWMAALKGERLWRIPVNGNQAGKPSSFFVGDYGRMRTIEVAPDGLLWLMTSNRDGRGDPAAEDDRILLIAP